MLDLFKNIRRQKAIPEVLHSQMQEPAPLPFKGRLNGLGWSLVRYFVTALGWVALFKAALHEAVRRAGAAVFGLHY